MNLHVAFYAVVGVAVLLGLGFLGEVLRERDRATRGDASVRGIPE